MRIFQITDLHIGRAEERPFEVNVRDNFLQILDEMSQHSYDLLVISGDLCLEDGDADIYHWIKAQLQERQLNYLIIPGNHDDSELMVNCFGLPDQLKDNFFFYLEAPNPPVLFLNSGPGTVSTPQVKSLEQHLALIDAPACLFMHHPPLPMGVPYMDNNHAIKAADPMLEVLSAHPHPITIFTGHYHVEKSLRWKNLDIHITPSCFFQINWREQDFSVDHHRCAFRWIEWDGARLEHGLIYTS